MKRFRFFLMMFLTAALCAGFQSCSDDDGSDGNNGGNSNSGSNGNSGTLEPPVYSEEAVKCEFTDSNAPYESLELTESGDYILILRDSEPNVEPVNTASPLRSVTRAGSGSNVDNGTYRKIGEKTYELSGFGKVVFSENSIQITPLNGTTATYDTTILPKFQTSYSIDQLCRSWKCVQWRIVAHAAGYGDLDKSFSSYDAYYQYANEDSDPVDMTGEGFWCEPTFEHIILSTYGTLALSGREYHDNTYVGLSLMPELWRPIGNNVGEMYFPYDEGDDSYNISFKVENDRMVLTVVSKYNDEEGIDEGKLICTYVENKH